jgi:hypothetical protein
MKISLFALSVALFTVMATNEVKAQKMANAEILPFQTQNLKPSMLMDGIENINPKAVKNFTRTYKDVRTETWIQTQTGFAARFNDDGIRHTILYDNHGNWIGVVKNYTEEKLPKEVRNMVKSKYFDYSIFYVDEVESVDSDGIPTYVVHIEDKTSFKLIRVYDGQMEAWKEYLKQ